MYINGAPYALSTSEILTYTGCLSGGGPNYLWGGIMVVTTGTAAFYNSGTIEINSCVGISSFSIRYSNIYAGISYAVQIDLLDDVVCPITGPSTVCIGDNINLSDISTEGTRCSSLTKVDGVTKWASTGYKFRHNGNIFL